MIFSTRNLPEGYRQTDEINLSTNKGLALLLSLAALVIFIPSFVLAEMFLRWVRPELATGSAAFTLNLVGFFVSVPLMLLVHELIHGFFFWVFTRNMPVFALRLLYAYAAAPDWFIPARQYWIIGLAPLVLIDVIGLLLILVASPGWVPVMLFLVALNTGGSVGDIFIVARLLRLSPNSFIKDAGDRVSFFEPAAV